MLRRQGFTLIELLIVVTIIAILAGAAVPYVQDYVEQARTGRAKADLDEIKRAIMLYEVQYGSYTGTSIASLVGPFLTKNTPDPWGNGYYVNNASSSIYSFGPDGLAGTGDEITTEFRPRMAVTRVYYVDANGDEVMNDGDALYVKVCRPASGTVGIAIDTAQFEVTEAKLDANFEWLNSNTASFTLINVNPVYFKPGSSTFIIKTGNKIEDMSNTPAKSARADVVKIVYQ